MPGMLRPEGTLTDRSVWNVSHTAGFPPPAATNRAHVQSARSDPAVIGNVDIDLLTGNL